MEDIVKKEQDFVSALLDTVGINVSVKVVSMIVLEMEFVLIKFVNAKK